MRVNIAKIWTYVSISMILVGILMLIVSVYFDDPNLIAIGLLICSYFIYKLISEMPKAIKISRYFNGKNIIAHWTYPGYGEISYRDKRLLRITIIILPGILLLGLIIYSQIAVSDYLSASFDETAIDNIFDIAFLLFVVGLRALIYFYTSYLISNASKEAFIGYDGFWLAGNYTFWESGNTNLIDVSVSMAELTFIYESLLTTNRHTFRPKTQCSIPIPLGKEEEATGVAEEIKNKCGLTHFKKTPVKKYIVDVLLYILLAVSITGVLLFLLVLGIQPHDIPLWFILCGISSLIVLIFITWILIRKKHKRALSSSCLNEKQS